MNEVYYKTKFNLEWPVNDVDEAEKYLTEDDMKVYLIDSLHDDNVDENEINKIISIEWHMSDDQSGYILLVANDIISNNILDKISEWVSGQNSDGLGEGFEQQDFAEYKEQDEDYYYDEETDQDYYYDNIEYHMASFDWRTNQYKFKRVSNANAVVEKQYHIMRYSEMV